MDTALGTLLTNKRRVSALKALGVLTVRDALTYYPFRVTDPVPARAIREIRPGSAMAFAAMVQSVRVVPMNTRRGYRLEALVDDSMFARTRGVAGATARLVFFSYKKSYVDWVTMRLHQGATVVVAGEPGEFNGQVQFTHPEILTIDPQSGSAGEFADGTDDSGATAGVLPAPSSSLRYDAATVPEALERVCRPRPVYHASSRISSDHIHDTIVTLLDGIDALPDILPDDVREERHLMHRADAFRAVHTPQSTEEFRRGIATLRYEEAFISQTALLHARHDVAATEAWPCPVGEQATTADNAGTDPMLRDRFIASLPFQLTGGQREVIDAIAADMSRNQPMQRLLQGEVGSGKTVVALAAMLQAVGAGYQAVLVAPTQVLAEQHAATITRMLAAVPRASQQNRERGSEPSVGQEQCEPVVPVVLLTGGMKLAARRRAMATAASGEPCIIVATHAAFSKTFQAPRLALVVIDEQHRFGVEQRESLRTRGACTPHLLVMTATPIPRTAAMTWFGDLDISWLTELPGGRKPIRTVVIREEDAGMMARMFAHIRTRIDAGERAYIVCARIDEDSDTADSSSGGMAGSGSGTDDDETAVLLDPYAGADDGQAAPRPPLHTVAQIAQRLSRLPQFQGVAFATLTGRDKDEVKQQVMAGFASGKTPVLVATTVIEVGVDVPQASCIVIFDADRYGLSQLHQLRGRVGRGGTSSWAFLISRAEPGSPAEQRLDVIRGTLDGAEIAQADLEFRGAGDVLGDAQSGGKSGLKLLRVVKDADLIADARRRAAALLEQDPQMSHEVQLAGAVLDFTRGNETFLTSS